MNHDLIAERLWPWLSEPINALGCLFIAANLAMITQMASGAWTATVGKDTRRGDPMRLACFWTGVLFIAFCVRRLWVPESDAALIGLWVLGICLVAFIMRLGKAYGRGPRV